jgi:cobalt-zinc-cadmium efflux system membrane fusion protein
MNEKLKLKSLLIILLLVAAMASAEDDHDEHEGHDDHEEEVALVFSAAERRAAGIETQTVRRRVVSAHLRLPGEVIPNAYRSVSIGPRISGQVVGRHARLGDDVKAGDPLIAISSVEMADAQGQLIVADREWQRVKGLGKEVVSARRYTEAQVARQLAMAKVIAYGMTEGQADSLIKKGDASLANGKFDLLATLDGTVVRDEFLIGEFVEPGRVLIEISDEHNIWIEARTSANKVSGIKAGMPARISANDRDWRDGSVVQIHHRLDEMTRTQAVRVEVTNEDHGLHAGQFVEVEIEIGGDEKILAVPTEAVVLLKGSPVVFHLEDGREFHPEPVQLGTTAGNWSQVLSGVDDGDVIAVRGTFYLKSLLLKSELGDGHAH